MSFINSKYIISSLPPYQTSHIPPPAVHPTLCITLLALKFTVAFGVIASSLQAESCKLNPLSSRQLYCLHYPTFPVLLSSSKSQWCVQLPHLCCRITARWQDSLGKYRPPCQFDLPWKRWMNQGAKEGSLVHTTEENYVKNSVIERGQTSESWGKVRHHAGFL